ncbi:MAG: hypothetical protein K8S54_08495 [Spirochaetia bacterium]|nr:hypothetical protein [Spirochaetia bacterium]
MNHFTELKGQPRALHILNQYLTRPIPPLLIFAGPDGTGKYSAAEVFVRTLFCDTRSACGQCIPCRKMLKGEHPDYIRFPADRVKIGDRKKPEDFTIRWLITSRLSYRPHEAEMRFVLFPDASAIQDEAETALLKTLEEPPEHTRFIFLVSDLQLLKPTVISRGVIVPFQLLPRESIRELSPGIDESTLDLLGGSLENQSIITSTLFNDLRARVKGIHSRLDLVELEKWLIDQEKGAEKAADKQTEPFGGMRLWELATLAWIHELAQEPEANRRKLDALFSFKERLHNEMPGYQPYSTSLLFAALIQAEGA